MYLFTAQAVAFLSTAVLAQQSKQKGYLGFNSGARLDDNKIKQQSDFEKEFKTAQGLQGSPGLFNSVRLYTNVQPDTTNTPIVAFQAALATNTTMLLGLWCSGTKSIDNELAALKAAITQHGQKFADLVVGISVGSEDLYRVSESGIENNAGLGQNADTIIKFINQTREAIANTPLSSKPVGHVDSWSAWANSSNSKVIEAVDFVGTDLYPYYEKDKGNDFSNLTSVYDYIYNQTLSATGDKPVWITETGWPASGPKFGAAVPSLENAQSYWYSIGCKLFGRTNVWWYTLRDSNSANKEKFAITKDLSTTPLLNLTCPADSGAPAAINLKPAKSTGSITSVMGSGAYFVASIVIGVLVVL